MCAVCTALAVSLSMSVKIATAYVKEHPTSYVLSGPPYMVPCEVRVPVAYR